MELLLKKAYRFMFTLLMLLASIFVVLLVVAKPTYLSSNYWIKIASEEHVQKKTAADINQSIQDLGLGSGIPADGLSKVISEERVTKDMNAFITHSFNQESYVPKQEEIKGIILSAVTKYAKDNGKEISDKNKESVDYFVENAYNLYDSEVRNPLVSAIGVRIGIFNQLYLKLLAISLIGMITLIILLYLFTRKYKHIFFRWLAYWQISLSLLLGSIGFLSLLKNPIPKLSLSKPYLVNWINTGATKPLYLLVGLSVAFLVVGIILAYLSNKKRNKLIENRKEIIDN